MPLFTKKFHFLLLILFALVFNPLSSSGENSQPLPRRGWEKVRAEHKGKGPVLWVALPKDGQKVYSDHVYYSGCTEPRATLTINHKTTSIYPNGAFVGSLPVKVGVNKFYFRSYGQKDSTLKIVQVIRYKPPEALPAKPLKIADSRPIMPDYDLELLPGESIEVKCQGSPGARAWFLIGDDPKKHPMEELSPSSGRAAYAGVYQGSYTTALGDAFARASIRIVFEEALASSARERKPKTVSLKTKGTLTTLWDLIQRFVEVKADDTPLYPKTVESGPIARLWKATPLEVIGRRGRFLHVRLGEAESGWILVSSVRSLPSPLLGSKTPSPSQTKGFGVSTHAISLTHDPKNESSTLSLDLDYAKNPKARAQTGFSSQTGLFPIPVKIDTARGDNTLTLTVYGLEAPKPSAGASSASASSAWFARLLSSLKQQTAKDPLIKNILCKRPDDLTLVFNVELNRSPVWGYAARFEKGRLSLNIKGPPAISHDPDKPLAGIKILISPGHGGTDSGTIGAAGLYESTVNLAISKRLAELLEKGGAQAQLMREKDTSMLLEDRARQIEQSDAHLFISIHNNSLDPASDPLKSRGPLTYFTHGHQLDLAVSVQQSMPQLTGVPPNAAPVRQAQFRVTRRSTNMPAVLAECLFLSHPEDEILLLSPAFLDRLAEGLYKGIVNFMTSQELPQKETENKKAQPYKVFSNKRRVQTKFFENLSSGTSDNNP